MTINKKQILKSWKTINLVMKGIYHYIDLVTDIMLVILFYESYSKATIPKLKQQIFLMFIILIFLLVWERISTYNYFVDIRDSQQKQIKSQQEEEFKVGTRDSLPYQMKQDSSNFISYKTNQMQSQNSTSIKSNQNTIKKWMIFLITASYTDYFYILCQTSHVKNVENAFIQIMRKDLIQLYAENIAFSALSTFMLFRQFVAGNGSVDASVVIAMASSILTVAYITYKSYVARYKMQSIIKSKDEIQFKDLQLDTKVFITDPFKVNLNKMFSDNIYQFKDLVIKREDRKPLQYKKNLPYCDKFFIIFYVFTQQLMFTLIIAFSKVTILGINPQKGLILGAILMLPQVLVYARYRYQQCKNWKEKAWLITKCIIGWPAYGIQACVLFYMKMFTEKLPFIDKIKESWPINFYPSWVFMAFKHLFAGLETIILFYILYFADFEEDKWILDTAQVKDSKALKNLQDSTGGFFHMTNVIIVCYSIAVIIDVAHCINLIKNKFFPPQKIVMIDKEVQVQTSDFEQEKQVTISLVKQGENKAKSKIEEKEIHIELEEEEEEEEEVQLEKQQTNIQISVDNSKQCLAPEFDNYSLAISNEKINMSGIIDQSHVPPQFNYNQEEIVLNNSNRYSVDMLPISSLQSTRMLDSKRQMTGKYGQIGQSQITKNFKVMHEIDSNSPSPNVDPTERIFSYRENLKQRSVPEKEFGILKNQLQKSQQ